MFFGKGENASRRGNSLLRFAAQEDPRARAGGTYVSLGAPQAELTASDIHRRARARRERVENAYLAELASQPETPARPEIPPEPAGREPLPPRPQPQGVLDAFARIDAAAAARARAGAQPHGPAARETNGLFTQPRDAGSESMASSDRPAAYHCGGEELAGADHRPWHARRARLA